MASLLIARKVSVRCADQKSWLDERQFNCVTLFSDSSYALSITMSGRISRLRLFKRNIINSTLADMTSTRRQFAFWYGNRKRFRKFYKNSRNTSETSRKTSKTNRNISKTRNKPLFYQARIHSPLVFGKPPRIPSVSLPKRRVKMEKIPPNAKSEELYITLKKTVNVNDSATSNKRTKSILLYARVYSPLLTSFEDKLKTLQSRVSELFNIDWKTKSTPSMKSLYSKMPKTKKGIGSVSSISREDTSRTRRTSLNEEFYNLHAQYTWKIQTEMEETTKGTSSATSSGRRTRKTRSKTESGSTSNKRNTRKKLCMTKSVNRVTRSRNTRRTKSLSNGTPVASTPKIRNTRNKSASRSQKRTRKREPNDSLGTQL